MIHRLFWVTLLGIFRMIQVCKNEKTTLAMISVGHLLPRAVLLRSTALVADYEMQHTSQH